MQLPKKDPRKILPDKEWNKLSDSEKWSKIPFTQAEKTEAIEKLLKPSPFTEFNRRFRRF